MYHSLDDFEKSNNTMNRLAPYVGKIRPPLAKYLISTYAKPNEYIYDPFAGSGTILLEGWTQGFNVIGTDLNYYAYILSLGKMHPYATLSLAETALDKYNSAVVKEAELLNISEIPEWVKSFFHEKTLKEICVWMKHLLQNKEWFLITCLLGILHHQRPGFLSYPSSHGAPYLRGNKYPKEQFPEMYEYRNVYDRLLKKVKRAYKSIPEFDFSLNREMYFEDSSRINLEQDRISTIITSPPYMKSLTYARDNRLRLWFLGIDDWANLDKLISPSRNNFLELMDRCFANWSNFQKKGDKCIVIIGDILINWNKKKSSLAEFLVQVAEKKYKLISQYQDPIPEARKVVKGNTNIKSEIILVFERV